MISTFLAISLLIANFSTNVNSTLRTGKLSAYCHGSKQCKGVKSKGITASGARVKRGIVAADPKFHPIGTQILIVEPKSYAGIYSVQDTGRDIKGYGRFDLWVPDYYEAKQIGKRPVKFVVQSKGNRAVKAGVWKRVKK